MKKILKFILFGIGGLIALIAIALTYVKTALPNVGPAPEMTIESTPEKVERGKYLAHHVALCMDCHSERNWSLYAGPMVDNTLGQGGEIFNQDFGFPGSYISPNITPAGLADWTDGEIFRAITTGVSKDGRALFPIMPYLNYGQMSQYDLESIIAYIRTLPAIAHETAPSKSDFPMNFIINTLPTKAELTAMPDPANLIDYGKYVTTTSGCYDCHTKQVNGQYVGEPFAGGMEFKLPDGSLLRSPNITPHATGMETWTEEQFVQRFKMYADSAYVDPNIKPGDFQTLMPWTMYAGMTETDLRAIYAYLMSLDPVENTVEKFVVASAAGN